MQIGEVIRSYRKQKNLTQEDVAKCLNVTAPAVNKWENGNSYPDIALLSPIARLLDISLDTLLCHEYELPGSEVNAFTEELSQKLKNENLDDVFRWMKQCIAKYPNSGLLSLCMAGALNGHLQMNGISGEAYEDYILLCYRRALESGDKSARISAAEMLYYHSIQKEEYARAEEYLEYFSVENPERKRKQAQIYHKTGRLQDARRMYEELLYTGYQNLHGALHDLYILAVEENDLPKARYLNEKMQSAAELFEMGEYHVVSAGFELAVLTKNQAETLEIMERMLECLPSIHAFTKSPLYADMPMKKIDETFLQVIREDLLTAFRDEETYSFLKDNPRWKTLTGEPGA